jgi:hypothetical protein
MTTITYTRPAKCKDCKFCKPEFLTKMKRHRCNNNQSFYFNSQITLKRLVCDKWELL